MDKKLFSTRYFVNGVQFDSHIFAVDRFEADCICALRGLGEVVESEIWYGTEETVSSLFERSANPIHVLHGVVWLSNIMKDTDTLNDKGLLHELIHYYSDPDEPIFKTKQQLLSMIKEYENSVPGYLP